MLQLPVRDYQVGGYAFGEKIRRRGLLWATHLGDDVTVPAGTAVTAIGEGAVVLAEVRAGTAQRRNWGGVVVLAHQLRDTRHETRVTGDESRDTGHELRDREETSEQFYSVYGHLTDLQIKTGDRVAMGQQLGVVAGSLTPENGWWQREHLHFGIYVGPWRGAVLPGWWRPEAWLWGRGRRTRRSWWRDPRAFIKEHSG